MVAAWWGEARGQHRRLAELERLSLFASSSRQELASITGLLTRMEIPAGTTVVQEGERGQEFFVIVSGRADVVVGGQHVANLSAGEFFGEIALLDHSRRSATVTAQTDLVVEVCSMVEFRSLLVGAPAMTRRLLAAVAGRLRVAGTPAVPASLAV